MTLLSNTRIVRASYANKAPVSKANFGIQSEQTIDLSSVKDGQVILRNLYLSLDPYIRHTLDGSENGTPDSWKVLGATFSGLGVSEVVASAVKHLPVGTLVSGNTGYEQYTTLSGLNDPSHSSDLRILPAHARDESTGVPLSSYVSCLGMPGLTAYAGLKVLDVKAGKTLFVGSAAGGVGQLVGQLAKLQGLRVIGSAGSDEKVNYLLKEQHFDAAYNYKTEGAQEALARLAPEGVDYFFDTVGGETLDVLMKVINEHGRILSVGMISQEDGKEAYPIRNLKYIVTKGVTIIGFIYWHHVQYFNGELDQMIRPLLERKEIVYREQIFDGIETAPEHFVNMVNGEYAGKVIIKVADL